MTGAADDPALLGVAAARREIGARRLSALELTRAVLARTAELDGGLNAYLHLDEEGALEQAGRADERPDHDAPLRGIPICIKDVIDVAGMPTTAGSAGWRRDPTRDVGAVARLRAAGAIVVGKGNTNEFAYGADGLNPHRGDCRNPHDPARIAGGSSAGPAVAAATGMALAGVGTDTSGSIRIPASLSGLVGVRPAMGRVPRSGVVPLAWSYDTVGPLARTVEDAALLLAVLSGADPPPSVPPSDVRGLRLGIVEQLIEVSEPYVADGLVRAAVELEAQGATLVPVHFGLLDYATPLHLLVQQAEAARVHAPWFDSQRDRYAEPVRRRLEAGRLVPAASYLAAQQARRLFVEDVARTTRGVDLLLAPSTPLVAPRRDAAEVAPAGHAMPLRVALLLCTIPFTQLGSPVASVPIGAHEGLPFGMQIVGRPAATELVLRVAAACEAALGPAPGPPV